MNQSSSALLTDLYQLTMLQGYLTQRMEGTAVFECFVRKLPPRRGFLVAAGLEQALSYLETLRFTSWELDWIAKSGRFSAALVEYLTQFRFTGDVQDRKSTRLNSSHLVISYAVFCLKKKKIQ